MIGIGYWTAREWRRKWKLGKFSAELPKNLFQYEEGVRDRVLAMRDAGMSWEKIKRLTGVSSATGLKWLKERKEREAGIVKPKYQLPKPNLDISSHPFRDEKAPLEQGLSSFLGS